MAITVPRRQLFIGGQWTEPVRRKTLPVVNPATEDIIGTFPFMFCSPFELDQSILRVLIQSIDIGATHFPIFCILSSRIQRALNFSLFETIVISSVMLVNP